MKDFTNMSIDQICDAVKQARKDNNLTLQEVGDRLGIVRSGAHRKENTLGVIDTESFLKHIKAVGGALFFEPNAAESDVPYILRVLGEYKSGSIDVETASRKVIQRLTKK